MAKAFDKEKRLNEIKSLAISRGGKCLSNIYVRMHDKLKFKCKNGHVWEATSNSVYRRGDWCKMCSGTTGENICRYVLEKIFKTTFNQTRPSWLIGAKGYRLELDGYSEKLKMAFEYQGEQHYILNKFSRNKKRFKEQLRYDKIKVKQCKKMGVVLLIIPQFNEFTNKNVLQKISFILKNNNIENFSLDGININDYFLNKPINKNYLDISILAKNRGGKLLTMICSVNDYATFKCKYGHIFRTKASHIKEGSWCRFCGYKIGSSKKLKSIEEAHKLSKKYKGKCLSKKYLGARQRHLFECKNSHKFKRHIYEIRNGIWCKKCNKK